MGAAGHHALQGTGTGIAVHSAGADPGEDKHASELAEPGSKPFSCNVSPVPSAEKT